MLLIDVDLICKNNHSTSNTGKVLGYGIKADFTVTFHRKKVGHTLGLGKQFSGKVKVKDIGFEQKNMTTQCLENSPSLWIKNFPWKKSSGHKYTRGRVIIYGGQKEFTGATILSTQAALRTGTGSAKIICSKNTLTVLALNLTLNYIVEVDNQTNTEPN